jgi:demethylmenaquinone methyltransferase/2-methoxy-6-polyprenyl-1,4-benzoquinol methylase
MANVFYSAGNGRAAKVNDLFGGIAKRYDFINDMQSFGLHRAWKNRVIRLANPKPGERALDLCCGTGDIALALASADAEVVGLDFSEPMLEIARHKLMLANSKSNRTSPEPRRVQFVQGDAMQTRLPDSTFDIVTVAYGLRNLASWETGLEEMRRVAKPGGRLLVLDFGKPDNALWRAIYFGYLRFFVPVLGRIFCGNAAAYAYILESLKHFPAQRGIAEKMRALGLKNVQTINLLGGIMGLNCAEK